MKKLLIVAALALDALTACSSSDDRIDDSSPPSTDTAEDTTTTVPNTTTTVAQLDHDGIVAALTGAGLCDDPAAGDAAGEALGSLEPTAFTTCTRAGAAVYVWTYPTGDHAAEAADIAGDYACSLDGGGTFGLLLTGSTIVQIDGPEDGQGGLTVVPSDVEALEQAAAVVGGSVRQPAC